MGSFFIFYGPSFIFQVLWRALRHSLIIKLLGSPFCGWRTNGELAVAGRH